MEHENYEEAIQVVNHFLSSSSNPLLELGIDLELSPCLILGPHLLCQGIERGNALPGLRRQGEVAEIAKGLGFSLQIQSRFRQKWCWPKRFSL
ncbi:hypothetical protein AMTRI_Chr06g175740 [Amborella trichopoda]